MCTSCQIGGICFQAVLFLHSHGKVEYRLKMKRQAERDSSPARAIPKRIREREREESRRDDGPTPLAVSLADTRCYHKHQARSRSREREKPRLREERGAVGDWAAHEELNRPILCPLSPLCMQSQAPPRRVDMPRVNYRAHLGGVIEEIKGG